jgi:hypothetical protein
MTNSSVDFKINHEWAINNKQFRGYAGVMDMKLVVVEWASCSSETLSLKGRSNSPCYAVKFISQLAS